jgi:hypothetical protein
MAVLGNNASDIPARAGTSIGGGDGAEIGTVLRALNALGLSIVIGNEPRTTSERSAPASNLDEVFARLKRSDPLLIPGSPSKGRDRKSTDKT